MEYVIGFLVLAPLIMLLWAGIGFVLYQIYRVVRDGL